MRAYAAAGADGDRLDKDEGESVLELALHLPVAVGDGGEGARDGTLHNEEDGDEGDAVCDVQHALWPHAQASERERTRARWTSQQSTALCSH